jgi:hypothetical protein
MSYLNDDCDYDIQLFAMQSAKMRAEANLGSIKGPVGIKKIKYDAYRAKRKKKIEFLLQIKFRLQEAVTDMRLVPPLTQVCEDHHAYAHRRSWCVKNDITPSSAAGLDKKIEEVLVLATKMELTSIELEV